MYTSIEIFDNHYRLSQTVGGLSLNSRQSCNKAKIFPCHGDVTIVTGRMIEGG